MTNTLVLQKKERLEYPYFAKDINNNLYYVTRANYGIYLNGGIITQDLNEGWLFPLEPGTVISVCRKEKNQTVTIATTSVFPKNTIQ